MSKVIKNDIGIEVGDKIKFWNPEDVYQFRVVKSISQFSCTVRFLGNPNYLVSNREVRVQRFKVPKNE